jgi:hypothetical protein
VSRRPLFCPRVGVVAQDSAGVGGVGEAEADRLVVSSRTVKGHIYRACIKLDVTDHEGLALVIRRGRGD